MHQMLSGLGFMPLPTCNQPLMCLCPVLFVIMISSIHGRIALMMNTV